MFIASRRFILWFIMWHSFFVPLGETQDFHFKGVKIVLHHCKNMKIYHCGRFADSFTDVGHVVKVFYINIEFDL